MEIEFVKHKDGESVIDSRIVAQKLGIDHSDWLNNVIKNEEYATVRRDELFGYPREDKEGETDFVWLTENQLFWYGTLIEDNTPEVVDFKCQLVKSFFSMKDRISGEQEEVKKTLFEKLESICTLYCIPIQKEDGEIMIPVFIQLNENTKIRVNFTVYMKYSSCVFEIMDIQDRYIHNYASGDWDLFDRNLLHSAVGKYSGKIADIFLEATDKEIKEFFVYSRELMITFA